MHASCPDIDHPSLIFPWYIEAGEGSRWALLVRKEAMRKGRKNMWKFVLLDPAGGEDTAEAIASLINERTTLELFFQPRGAEPRNGTYVPYTYVRYVHTLQGQAPRGSAPPASDSTSPDTGDLMRG